jgi:hypothetical protein
VPWCSISTICCMSCHSAIPGGPSRDVRPIAHPIVCPALFLPSNIAAPSLDFLHQAGDLCTDRFGYHPGCRHCWIILSWHCDHGKIISNQEVVIFSLDHDGLFCGILWHCFPLKFKLSGFGFFPIHTHPILDTNLGVKHTHQTNRTKYIIYIYIYICIYVFITVRQTVRLLSGLSGCLFTIISKTVRLAGTVRHCPVYDLDGNQYAVFCLDSSLRISPLFSSTKITSSSRRCGTFFKCTRLSCILANVGRLLFRMQARMESLRISWSL